MIQNKLNLKQIAESVVKHVQSLQTERVFGMIKVNILNGKPHQYEFTESKLAKDLIK